MFCSMGCLLYYIFYFQILDFTKISESVIYLPELTICQIIPVRRLGARSAPVSSIYLWSKNLVFNESEEICSLQTVQNFASRKMAPCR